MSIPFTPEQIELADTLRRFLSEKLTSSYIRKRIESDEPTDPKLWNELLELGLLSAFATENAGGSGLGFRELGILAEESGRALLTEPILDFAFAGSYLLTRNGTETSEVAKALPRITSGEIKVAFAPRVSVSGKNSLVIGGGLADWLVISDFNNTGTLSTNLKELNKKTCPLVDGTIRSTSVEVSESKKFKTSPNVEVLYGILKSLEIVGASEKSIEMTVEHGKTRKQFDAPIGSFQAVQHKLADAFVSLSSMKALCRFAAWAVESSPEQIDLAGRAAITFAVERGPKIIETCIQLHGGTGFTWEYDLHLYLRRVRSLTPLLTEIVPAEDLISAVR